MVSGEDQLDWRRRHLYTHTRTYAHNLLFAELGVDSVQLHTHRARISHYEQRGRVAA